MKITKDGFAIVERDTHLGKWVEETSRLDFDQSALNSYKKYFKEGGILLNIGANIGCYACAFVDVASEVICFEPNSEAYECLEYNLSKFNNVKMFKQALSDKKYGYDVVSENDNVGMAFIKESDNNEFLTTTIDDLNLSSLDFILIDVEGLELKVLEGGRNTILKYEPIMVIEINDHTLNRFNFNRDQIFRWLIDNNYTYRNIYDGHHMNDDQLDIICFPKNKK